MENKGQKVEQKVDEQCRSDAAVWRLCVVQGIHKGAEVELIEGDVLLVGSDSNCDIRLSDDGLCAQHITVMKRSDRVVVKSLEGGAQSESFTIDAGNQGDIAPGQTLRLIPADVEVQVKANTDSHISSHSTAEKASNKKSRLGLAIGMLSLLAILSAGSFVLAGSDTAVKHDAAVANIDIANSLIDKLNMSDEVYLEQGTSYVVVRGILSRPRTEALSAAFRQQKVAYQLRLKTAEQLLEQVGNVFRINGYAAKLRYLGNAVIEVQNLDGNNPDIRHVAEYVKQDVSDLASLQFLKQQTLKDTDGGVTYQLDSGRRLTAVVDGDTAYVAATDGSRYFVGSILPGGYSIRQISADGVEVDKRGELAWLTF